MLKAGKIGAWGVSNFDAEDMQRLMKVSAGRAALPTRSFTTCPGADRNLTCCHGCRKFMPLMAYSPFDQGRLAQGALEAIGKRHKASAAQIALAFTLRRDGIIAIPKAGTVAHVEANAAAAAIELTPKISPKSTSTFHRLRASNHWKSIEPC